MARTLSTIAALGAAVALAITATSAAAAPASAPGGAARVTVTIKAEGTDLSGRVSSPMDTCAAERKVVVYKQKGARGGGDDKRFATDTAGEQNGKWVWSTGNTGTEGRFYAKVRPIAGCKGDSSPTIRAERND